MSDVSIESSKCTTPIWKMESFELDPHRSLGVVVIAGDLSRNSMELVKIVWVNPLGQGALVWLRRGDLIYQIGERRMTFHDDVFVVLSEQVSQACLKNSYLRLVILRNPE